MRFPHLFSPFVLKGLEIRNRIFSTGHDTYLPVGGLPSEALIAYQRARARAAPGLIVIQVVGVHETSRYTEALLMGTADDCIPAFRRADRGHSRRGHESASCNCSIPAASFWAGPKAWSQPAYAPSHLALGALSHVIPRRAVVRSDRRNRRRLRRNRAAHGGGRRRWRRDRRQPRLSAGAIPEPECQPPRATAMAARSRTGCASPAKRLPRARARCAGRLHRRHAHVGRRDTTTRA